MTEQDFSRRLLRGAAIDEEDGEFADLVTHWALSDTSLTARDSVGC